MPDAPRNQSAPDDVLFYIECARKGDSPEQCAKMIRRAVVAEILEALRRPRYHPGTGRPIKSQSHRHAANFIERQFGDARHG